MKKIFFLFILTACLFVFTDTKKYELSNLGSNDKLSRDANQHTILKKGSKSSKK